MKSRVFIALAVLAAGFGWVAGGTVAGAAEVPPVMTENVRTDAAGGDVILVRDRHHGGHRGFSSSGRHHSFSGPRRHHYSYRHGHTRWRGGHHHRRHHRGFYGYGPYVVLPYTLYSYGDDDSAYSDDGDGCYSNCRVHRGPRYCHVYCGY